MPAHLPPPRTSWAAVACLLLPLASIPAASAEPDMSRPTTGRSVAHIDLQIPLDYLIHFPEDYDPDAPPDRRSPLLIFLHGAGERGNDLEKLKKWGPPKLVEQGTLPPQLRQAVIVSPQCPPDRWWPSEFMIAALDQMFDDLLTAHTIDPDRVYLTGVSMGGFGTWAWAAHHPDRFAAIAPICGGGNFLAARRIAAAKLPFWAFHGDQDPIVPLAESLHTVQLIHQQNHTGHHARFTVLPNTQHNSWTPAYANPELWTWLFSHTRSTPTAPAD